MFESPAMLLLALVVPLLLGGYRWQRRRRRRSAVLFSSAALIRAAVPARSRLRRLLPSALFLLSTASLVVASARPQMSVTVPIGRTTIILALDVSRSMCATDVAPNRLAVSQAAARDFVMHQPRGTRIGLVEFAGFAELVLPPTTDRELLASSINAMTTAPGTAIGSALLASVDALASVNADIAPTTEIDPSRPTAVTPPGHSGYVSDIVVLLTDGANTQGVQPYLAARQASARGVRVYAIGFGTTNPTKMSCSAKQLGADVISDTSLGPGRSTTDAQSLRDDPRQFFVIDESALRTVAKDTGGAYFRASDARQLKNVFSKLPKKVELQRREVEISAVFAGIGAVLIGFALVLSLRWRRWP
jgi:Ca-activated chloride channel homolog